MGEVVQLKRPRKISLRGVARSALTEALDAAGPLSAVVIVVLGADGRFALRTASYGEAIKDFDMYSRAGALLDRERLKCID